MHLYGIPKKIWPNNIQHHGIMGQKWGVQNGPPYPLDSDISTGKRLKETSGSVTKKRNIDKDFPTLKEYSDKDLEDELYWLDEVESELDDTEEHFNKKYPITYSNLQKEIEEKSVDWYNSKGKSTDARRNREQYDQVRKKRSLARKEGKSYSEYDKQLNALDDDLLGIVLRDLGYEDTKRNRLWIRPVVRNG